MFNLETLHNYRSYEIVGCFTRSHVDPSLLLQAAVNYDSDPDWVDENLCLHMYIISIGI